MELAVINSSGADTGRKITLSADIFGFTPNDHAIYLDVKQYMANQRQGTHKSKEKWEINATTKKLKKQKGTGGARAGSMKSPLFIGGARVFGPRPRDYSFKLNKKLKLVARKSALAHKANNKMIVVVEDLVFDKPATKECISLLKNLNLTDKRAILVTGDYNKNLYLSGRNLAKVKVSPANELNTYEIMKAHSIILLESSIKVIEDSLNK
jgi:large subunit ribosomal protein L4